MNNVPIIQLKIDPIGTYVPMGISACIDHNKNGNSKVEVEIDCMYISKYDIEYDTQPTHVVEYDDALSYINNRITRYVRTDGEVVTLHGTLCLDTRKLILRCGDMHDAYKSYVVDMVINEIADMI